MRHPANVLPLLGFLLLSCGQMQPGDDAQPGGRLVPLQFKGADGTRAASLWFLDKQTGKQCGLTLVPGSKWDDPAPAFICTPGGAPVEAGTEDRYVRFTMEP